ncbi:FAD-binding and (Fe-S)-binding domain-containing protein [Thalassotalea sp. ND16A]|uniref:FAD-binding and (Fe-S)-binding domain-containing protein n=1 Tax=Thalassotalea sp. ND16A TaxID=1535422 RepID=UPI00051A5A8A|nr:FAD-binding and (Fe-S)-binding domain-containing protein [Thalassotalea sp. ND16A]KGJ99146.1 D-lactate dehydrogenase (cytochrome) [Thalassotalea sp. ND16A]
MAVNEHFLTDVRAILSKEQIIDDITRRRAFGTDASFYQLVPQLVLQIANEQQMQQVIESANQHLVAVTFRAAGTSLSGQAITDSVLLMLTNDWTDYQISQDGQLIRLQPGIIGADANRHLHPFERKLGPDPASINTCKIGGIAANNASGMCCGVSKNSYFSLADMTLILADGTLVNSADTDSLAAFKLSHKSMLNELGSLAQQVKENTTLKALIEHKYRLKNTTGYAINALVDYHDPVDILLHLMIGSEGTLGFIADITYKTVPDHQHKASGLFSFVSAKQACLAVTALSLCPVDAVELMDQRALNSVKGKDGLPERFCDQPDDTTALLIETRGQTAEELQQHIAKIEQVIASFAPIEAIDFTTDERISTQLWAIRKATFPAVGALRETGTTVIIEDVSFPIDKLAAGIVRLHELFDHFGYQEAIIFGHALAGNLHFVFTQSFESPEEIQRYDNFMHKVANLVAVEFGGSLKAEHGTGRNMAPFVELEWGQAAYEVMHSIKQIVDPQGILNPGVILNNDPNAHIKNLKLMPKADPIVDKCIECGFCEPVCPSKEFSLTPRQRIAIWRRIQQLNHQQTMSKAELAEHKELQKSYQHLGIDSCAATGLCAERCPVGINTGDLIRKLRGQKLGKVGHIIAKWSADHFSGVSKGAAIAFTLNGKITKLLGNNTVDHIGAAAYRFSGKALPLWHSKWPAKAHVLTSSTDEKNSTVQIESNTTPKVIFFASCASRTMGPSVSNKDNRSLTQVAHSVFTKAGYQVITPSKSADLCCGMPFHSKGAADIANSKGQQLLAQLSSLSNNGEIPIVFDTSPCNLRVKEIGTELPIFELTEFCAKFLLNKLNIKPKQAPVALHITCSSQKAGIADTLRDIANACAKEVIEPADITCCGYAGDKGMFMPELNKSALAPLAKQVAGCEQGYSNSRTCEIGLSKNSDVDYQSLIYLLDEVSESVLKL